MKSIFGLDRLQIWGGIECTVNRVGDTFHDQLAENGHALREDDIDRLADLQFDALRYPVLWERTAPDGLENIDWSWLDRRLGRLRELNIAPIAGLVHHGSGPRHTSLLDERFATGLAEYAAAVAHRYPWIEAYTPVNEPLTTARFSGLYGHWYPHERSDKAFATALTNQCLATALAMRAIRRVNPNAKLVLTEDLAKIHSTRRLARQAEFENQRRWLSIDLLLGRVDRQHPLWGLLNQSPRIEQVLLRLVDEPCPPDLLGFNYYLTSERFLDERLSRYAAWSHGGNGRQRYADVEAVRVRSEGIDGPELLLREAWDRFGLPMAITEVHLGGHREEQVRWLLDSWAIAHDLRDNGIELRAIAVWSLLGSYDWNSLCTRKNGCYEAGAFDVRGAVPRPTAIARTIKQLATLAAADTTAIPEVGWWRTDFRFSYPPVETGAPQRAACVFRLQPQEKKRPLLIVGPYRPLTRAFIAACKARRLAFATVCHELSDKDFIDTLDAAVTEHRPWALINTAVCSDVPYTQLKPSDHRCLTGIRHLAATCGEHALPLLAFSSEHVFDGCLGRAYVESDSTAPICEYGKSQRTIEEMIAEVHPASMVVRTSALFSPWDQQNFLVSSLRRLSQGQQVDAPKDWFVSPTYVPELVDACLDLLVDGEAGLWHLVHQGDVSWSEFLRHAADAANLPVELICERTCAELGIAPYRTHRTTLTTQRGQLLPPLLDAIGRYSRDCAAQWQEPQLSGQS